MANVIRIFVEKREGFDVEARQMLADLRDNLGMTQLRALRILNRYDVEGLSASEFARARGVVFSEPNADVVYDETLPLEPGWQVFAMEYLPGQYDQRADSAAQCVQLLTQGERPRVLTARVICLKGELSPADVERIQQYLVNPVESRLASLDKPETLDMTSARPADVARVAGFISMKAEEVEAYWKSMGFAMSPEDLLFCQRYFRDEERRDPTVTELRVIDTYWSDHCRHTTFLTRLESIEVEPGALSGAIETALQAYMEARREVYGGRIGQKNVSLMDMATMGMRMLKKQGRIPDLDESEEINACSIEVPVTIDGKTESWLVQFKNETHNHPTEIEPFGGAATCLGGAIRDPLSGRAYVYQAMRVTGSGDPRVSLEDTLPGKLPSRKITTGAAAGYSSYGNQIGLAGGQAPGDRSRGRRFSQGERGAGYPGGRRHRGAAGRPYRAGRLRRRHRLLQSPYLRVHRHLRCGGAKGQSANRTETSAALPGSAGFPDDQALQRFRRRRCLRGDWGTGPRPGHRAGPGSQKIRGP